MLAEFSSLITDMSDEKKTVLTNHEIHQAFKDTYVNVAEPIKTRFYRSTEEDDCTILSATIEKDGKVTSIEGKGNGPLDALCNGLRQFLGQQFEICNDLNATTQNMAVRKIRESLRISKGDKELVLKFKK